MIIVFQLLAYTAYAWAFARAAHRGFTSRGMNTLVIGLGFLLLVPSIMAGAWYWMTDDWPMNIGGKPNWTWFANEPLVGDQPVETLRSLIVGAIAAQVLVISSLVYAITRMLRAFWSQSKS